MGDDVGGALFGSDFKSDIGAGVEGPLVGRAGVPITCKAGSDTGSPVCRTELEGEDEGG